MKNPTSIIYTDENNFTFVLDRIMYGLVNGKCCTPSWGPQVSPKEKAEFFKLQSAFYKDYSKRITRFAELLEKEASDVAS